MRLAEFTPEGGWKEQAYYTVWVKLSPYNVSHKAILYTGFLDRKTKQPGNYSALWNPTYKNGQVPVEAIYWLEIISEITDMRRE